jgi:hypothetical protein
VKKDGGVVLKKNVGMEPGGEATESCKRWWIWLYKSFFFLPFFLKLVFSGGAKKHRIKRFGQILQRD